MTRKRSGQGLLLLLLGAAVFLYPKLFIPRSFRSGPGDHLGPLRAYLHAHYHVVKTFSDWDQIWERNP